MNRGLRWAIRAGAFVGALLPTAAAQATATLVCDIADPAVKMTAQAAVGNGAGETVSSLYAEIALNIEGAPPGLRAVSFDGGHMTQSWLYGRELRLRFYQDVSAGAPAGAVELIMQARRAGSGDEAPYRGRYELIVTAPPLPSGVEGKKLKTRGKVTCTVG